jgi:subtilisin family serine protease
MPKRLLVAAAVATLVVCVTAISAAARTEGRTAAARYIVVLKAGVDADSVASSHAARYGVGVDLVYRHALRGYAAVIPNERVAAVRLDDNVAYLEADGVATTTAQALPWGINRIDADVSSTRAGDGAGSVGNVNVYVIDTGVDTAHADLNVVGHVSFASGPNTDCNGHGSHVAGTIAARDDASHVVGAAPGAPITGVKVLGCSGSGQWSWVIAGIDWVTANARRPAIANMSLGGGANNAVDQAVRNSAASGVFYSVAAGNSGANACNYSPARAGAGTNNGIMTVAATDSGDNEASWSNYGSCVDVWGPGVGILSTWKGGGTKTISGTSMASPHAGGTGALYLSSHAGASAAGVESALRGDAAPTSRRSKDGRSISVVYAGRY